MRRKGTGNIDWEMVLETHLVTSLQVESYRIVHLRGGIGAEWVIVT
jgi:hypothetical protein